MAVSLWVSVSRTQLLVAHPEAKTSTAGNRTVNRVISFMHFLLVGLGVFSFGGTGRASPSPRSTPRNMEGKKCARGGDPVRRPPTEAVSHKLLIFQPWAHPGGRAP